MKPVTRQPGKSHKNCSDFILKQQLGDEFSSKRKKNVKTLVFCHRSLGAWATNAIAGINKAFMVFTSSNQRDDKMMQFTYRFFTSAH